MSQRSSLVSSRDYIDLNNYVIESESKQREENNQRVDDRCDLEQRITITNADTGEIVGHALNLSETGLCIMSNHELEPDQVLALHLAVNSRESNLQFIDLRAVVRWCEAIKGHNRHYAGLEITVLPIKSKFRLNSLLDKLSAANEDDT